jgi:8-oxo-dGTP pyrophosphatase MutT (NUDIX family)
VKPIAPLDRWALAVYVMVRDRRGRILLLRRSQTVKNLPGYWEFPGGKPAAGECLNRTADLEVTEETGLYVTPTGIAGASECTVGGLRVAMLFFEAGTAKTEVTLSPEHDTFCWLPPGRAASVKLRPGFERFIEDYAKLRRGNRRPRL